MVPDASDTLVEDKLYSYAIVRADLQMDAGKLASQAAHACAQSLVEFLARDPSWIAKFRELGKSGSRITLKAKNLNQMLRAYKEAQEAGLPCSLFIDEGHVLLPHFDGSPIPTAVGIGPCRPEECRKITKRYQCV